MDDGRMSEGPTVETTFGAVCGRLLGEGAAAFRGIPFAAPPVGALRWREAQPHPGWSGVRDAAEFGSACPQRRVPGDQVLPQDEDCLTLNVVTPDVQAKGLPVLFSIHGGAFFVGSGRYIADRDLSPLVRRGVVLVSANYRIGRFGFFAHPALTAEAGQGTGNFWLSDQLAALRWVRDNIAAFGGDPAAVTIMGCSAGGSSVNVLMTSPSARGLFARASVHSGGGLYNASRTLDFAEREGIAFARRAGVEGNGTDDLDRLRALSVDEILAADPGPPDFGAILDGHHLPEPIAAAFAHKRQAAVPLIVGSTSNEASIFGMMGFDAQTIKARFGIDIADLREVYVGDGAEPLDEAELLRRVQTDFLFTTASLSLALLASRSAPTWSYHFGYVPHAQRGIKPGASHCADMPYILTDDARRSEADGMIAALQQKYWYNFIATGDPNGAPLPHWPAVEPGNLSTLIVGDETCVVHDLHRRRLSFWQNRWREDHGARFEF